MKVAAALIVLVASLVHVQGKENDRTNDAVALSQPERKTNMRQQQPRQQQSDRELGVDTTRVLVHYRNGHGKDEAMARSSRLYHDFHKKNVLSIEIDEQHMRRLSEDPNIVSIDEDRLFEAQGFHEKTLTEEEFAHRRLQQTIPYGVQMVEANKLNVKSRSRVKVCVVDTGVARQHPDLPKRFLTGAKRMSSINGNELNWSTDMRGHGTHITGTINARNNDYGVRGIGKVPVFMTRALDDNGQARESDVYGAVEQCTNSGAKVISMSLGGGGMSQTFKDLLTSLYDDKGFLLVAASGNYGQASVSWPAAHPRVIAVGAVQEDKSIWPNSNYGSEVELSAPGKMILSTTVNKVGAYVYSFYSGTSMAAPHVAGVAALVWSHFPECSNTQIRYALTRTAMDEGSNGCDNYFGWGIVQARAAFDWLKKNECAGSWWGKTTEPKGGCS